MSFNSILQENAETNPNLHIYCHELTTPKLNVDLFNVSDIQTQNITVAVETKSNYYAKSENTRLVELSTYSIERMNAVVYNVPISPTPSVFISTVKGSISGLTFGYLETGRMYHMDYLMYFVPSAVTISNFTLTLGNTTTAVVSNTSTSLPTSYLLSLDFTVLSVTESACSLIYYLSLRNETNGTIAFAQNTSFNTTCNNFFLPLIINYSWSGTTAPTSATRLKYNWSRIA